METWDEQAKAVLSGAREEARKFGHRQVRPEHILLALLHDPNGTAAQILSRLGVDFSVVRPTVESIVEKGTSLPNVELLESPRFTKILQLALDEARVLLQREVGSEHLLIGLLREGESVAACILDGMDVTLPRVRAALQQASPV